MLNVRNIIPYVGPYIGVLPAVIVAIGSGLVEVISVLVVTVIVQQVDGNLVYPNVIKPYAQDSSADDHCYFDGCWQYCRFDGHDL